MTIVFCNGQKDEICLRVTAKWKILISIPYCLSIKKTIRLNESIHHSLDKSLSRQASPRSSRSGSCSCRTSRTGSPGRQRRASIRSCRSVGYNRFYDTALYSFAVSMSYNRFYNTVHLCYAVSMSYNQFYNTVHLCNAVSMSYNTLPKILNCPNLKQN